MKVVWFSFDVRIVGNFLVHFLIEVFLNGSKQVIDIIRVRQTIISGEKVFQRRSKLPFDFVKLF